MKQGRPVGYKCSNETKELMRQKKLGVKKSPEHVLHNSQAQAGNRTVVFPDNSKHRVYAKSFDDFLEEAREKNWWLTEKEAESVWNMVQTKRTK